MTRSRDLGLGCLVGIILFIVVAALLYMRGSTLIESFVNRFQRNPTVIDLHNYAPPGWKVSGIQRLDLDADGVQEWVVFYQYDVVGSRNPVTVVIYDAEGNSPPIFYPYPLRAPGSDPLGELGQNATLSMALEDVLPSPPNAATPNELILTDGTTLSIFAVRDVQPTAAGPCIEYPNPYECVAFFKGNLRVQRAGSRVSVWDRSGSERSQFALVRIYQASGGSYFFPGTTQLLPPAEARIDFAYGMPSDILETPYPEKLVLAFYDEVLTGNAAQYLTTQAAQRFAAGQLDYGSPWSLIQTTKVLVQEISFTPAAIEVGAGVSSAQQPTATEVRVKARFFGPGGQSRLRDIVWLVVREGTRWKLADASAADSED